MNKNFFLFIPVFFLLCGYSCYTTAKISEANTPVNQLNYEKAHQGILNIRAAIYNAPCDLGFDLKRRPILVGCGAGDAFNNINLFNFSAGSPVKIQYFDIERRMLLKKHKIILLNGVNSIKIPMKSMNGYLYRLEVSYD